MKDYVIDRKEFDSSGEWSLSNALHMMKLSYTVYAGTTDIIGAVEDWSIARKLVEDAGYQIHKIEKKEGIYEPNAMICWDDKNVFLIFRGTEPLKWNQWATDANFLRKSFCIGEIHQGFANSVELIWPEIMECLLEVYVGKSNLLFVGGHSLGSAMSLVVAAKLEFEENLHPAAVYNFGCPRTFNFNGASLYNQRLGSRTFRVVNNNDIVCNIPLENMGFSHVGQFKYLTSSGDLRENPADWWLMLDGAWGGVKALADLNLADPVIDHIPKSYLKCLSEIV